MAFLDHNGEIEVPYSKADAFKSMKEAINMVVLIWVKIEEISKE